VKLGLVRGIELSDPQRLLEGKGKFHRHIPRKRPSDLGKPGIKWLVRSTLVAWRQRQVTSYVVSPSTLQGYVGCQGEVLTKSLKSSEFS
jgi:hypothetical protein